VKALLGLSQAHLGIAWILAIVAAEIVGFAFIVRSKTDHSSFR
jgi:hypothetical protein